VIIPNDNLSKKLASLGQLCKSVVACRVSPLQKAQARTQTVGLTADSE
jgi:hypothetical protein